MYYNELTMNNREERIAELESELCELDNMINRVRNRMICESDPKNGQTFHYLLKKKRAISSEINELIKYEDIFSF